MPLEVNPHSYDSSHTKTFILLQCHFGQLPLPSTDYNTDTKSVLDQAIRILQVSIVYWTPPPPPHETFILLQCHFGQLPLPSTDYNTDTKSVLDQAIRILQVGLVYVPLSLAPPPIRRVSSYCVTLVSCPYPPLTTTRTPSLYWIRPYVYYRWVSVLSKFVGLVRQSDIFCACSTKNVRVLDQIFDRNIKISILRMKRSET